MSERDLAGTTGYTCELGDWEGPVAKGVVDVTCDADALASSATCNNRSAAETQGVGQEVVAE